MTPSPQPTQRAAQTSGQQRQAPTPEPAEIVTVDRTTGEVYEPTTLAMVYNHLIEPFDMRFIELKPGATTRDKTKALGMCYADPRAYQNRLDDVVGPDNWEVHFERQSDGSYICRLRILGVVKSDVSDPQSDSRSRGRGGDDDRDTGGGNGNTTSAAQAFKRACSMFGLGRYLYDMPQRWLDYDGQKKKFVDPDNAIRVMYKQMGYIK